MTEAVSSVSFNKAWQGGGGRGAVPALYGSRRHKLPFCEGWKALTVTSTTFTYENQVTEEPVSDWLVLTECQQKRHETCWMETYVVAFSRPTKAKQSSPATRPSGAWGERSYSSYSFLTSALDGGEWSASRSGRALPRGKDPRYPLYRRLDGPQSRSGHRR
jgi:hypothetical protein